MGDRISVDAAFARLEHSEPGCKRKFVPNLKKALNKKLNLDDGSHKVPRNDSYAYNNNNTTNNRVNNVRGRGKSQQRAPREAPQFVQSYSIFESGIGCAVKSDRSAVQLQEIRSTSGTSSSTKVQEITETEIKEDPFESCGAFVTDIKQIFKDPPIIMRDSAANSGASLDPLKNMDLSEGRNHHVPFDFFSDTGQGRLFTLQLPDKLIPTNLDELKDGRLGKIQVLDNQQVRLVVGDATFDLISPHPLKMATDVVLADQQNSEFVQLNSMGHIEQSMLAVPSLDEFTSLGR